jgi:hypothetical protein
MAGHLVAAAVVPSDLAAAGAAAHVVVAGLDEAARRAAREHRRRARSVASVEGKSDAPYDTTKQTAGAIQAQRPTTDQVELLAFLKAPGTLVITQGTDVQTKDVSAAGVVSFSVPIVPGTTPAFELQRDGHRVQRIQSATPIQERMVYQDMMYHAGGGLSCARPTE